MADLKRGERSAARLTGMAIATAAAGLFTSGYAADTKVADDAGKVMCAGVNSCKGTSECKGSGACKGHNKCKGQGIKVMPKADCEQAGGKVVVARQEAGGAGALDAYSH